MNEEHPRFSQEIVGVTLAAGGSMLSLQILLPKPVLPVLDKPILPPAEAMVRLGIHEAIVVSDTAGTVVRRVEHQPHLGLEIDSLAQESNLGIAHCADTGKRHRGPVSLFLGDITSMPPGGRHAHGVP